MWCQHWWMQYLFESRNDVIVMPCGHTIHKSCLNEMREHFQWVLTELQVYFFLHLFLNIVFILVFDCVSGSHALSVQSRSVICQRFGRNWTWRLLLHQCLSHIKTKWSVFFPPIWWLFILRVCLRVSAQNK